MFDGLKNSMADPMAIRTQTFPDQKSLNDPGRLNQDNVKFNKLKSLDDLFGHLNKCDDDLLNALVAEFVFDFPDTVDILQPELNEQESYEPTGITRNEIRLEIQQTEPELWESLKSEKQQRQVQTNYNQPLKQMEQKQLLPSFYDSFSNRPSHTNDRIYNPRDAS